MPRRAAAVRREIAPDSVYNNRLVTQLVNKILLDGKKSTAENIVYGAFEVVEQRTGARSAGHLQEGHGQRPSDAGGSARSVLAAPRTRFRWRSIPVARPRLRSAGSSASLASRREKTMAERLAAEIMDAANGTGSSVKRREDLFKMAESNRAFSHYRW